MISTDIRKKKSRHEKAAPVKAGSKPVRFTFPNLLLKDIIIIGISLSDSCTDARLI